MKLFTEILFTVFGMGFTTLGLILMIEHRNPFPAFLLLVGIPILLASVEISNENPS